jgi:hypothetical protein
MEGEGSRGPLRRNTRHQIFDYSGVWPNLAPATRTTRYKTWRSGPDAELHVIVYEGAELPFGVSSLGPWLGSKEGEVANIETPLQGDARGYWVRGGATESGGVQDGGVTCRRPSAVGPFPGRALSFLKPASRRLLCAASTAENQDARRTLDPCHPRRRLRHLC